MIYQIHNNEGTIYVEANVEEIRRRMYKYIKDKQAKGYSLASIIFVYHRIHIHHWRKENEVQDRVHRSS